MNITTLALSLAPVVISVLTQFVKETPLFEAMSDAYRNVILKFITAGLALASGLVAYAANGVLDQNLLEAFLVSGALFLATFIPYWFGKLKRKK